MKQVRWMTMVLVVLCVAVAPLRAEGMKVAVVDLAKIVRVIPEATRADEHLAKQAEAFSVEREAYRKKMDDLKEEFEKRLKASRDEALSEKGRAAKRDEAEASLKGLRIEEQKMRQRVAQRKKEMTEQSFQLRKTIEAKVHSLVKTYAQKEEYDLVLDVSARGMSGFQTVVYHSTRVDITESVLKTIEK